MAVFATGAVGDGHEVGADLEETVDRVPEGGLEGGFARRHNLKGEQGGLMVVGTGAGVNVVRERHYRNFRVCDRAFA